MVIQIILTSLGSMAVLFVLTKLMGDREMSQLSMFDYVNSITIGSIAAEMATALEGDYIKPLIALIVYGLATLFIAYSSCKSILLRRIFVGHPVILYHEGRLYKKNLLKVKLDVNEFLSLCRVSGYFDLKDIHTAILESNGKLSVLPVVKNRPVTPEDLNLSPTQDNILANVIIDGHIMKDNLKATGKNDKWIEKQLSNQKVKSVKDVYLGVYDNENDRLDIYIKLTDKIDGDIFI
jgi:uncharacterized membrane protein YcaP (DUF421 family)